MKLFKRKKMIQVPKTIGPEDYLKEPKTIRHKMDKIYLDLDKALDPKTGLRKGLIHKHEINNDVDEYMHNMKAYTTRVGPDLDMPKDKFIHIGYYLQADWYDLDGKHLYATKRWDNDLEKALDSRTPLLVKTDRIHKEIIWKIFGVLKPDWIDMLLLYFSLVAGVSFFILILRFLMNL